MFRSYKLILVIVVLVSSCYKLEDNSKRYTVGKLNKMLDGNWELTDYQIDGVSYLDTVLKTVSAYCWNCKNYQFNAWKGKKGTHGLVGVKKGTITGDCENHSVYDSEENVYSVLAGKKLLYLNGPYLVDPIHFNTYKEGQNYFTVLKLEKEEMILSSEKEGRTRKIFFSKK